MTVKLLNMAGLEARFNKMLKEAEKSIVDARKKVATELMKALIENTPVWSGRAVRSISVSNGGGSGNTQEKHPDRGDADFNGTPWHYHSEFGATSRMPLGSEPMRAPSEAIAMATIESADFSLSKPVVISSNSYMWAEIDSASAPTEESARNQAVVSRIAIDKVRSAMKGIVQ